jgi:hypothetical protein
VGAKKKLNMDQKNSEKGILKHTAALPGKKKRL